MPNGMLAKAPIVNYTKPTRMSRRSVYVSISYDVPPQRVHRVILDGDPGRPRRAPRARAERPHARVRRQRILYWLRRTDQFERRDGVDGGVRDRLYYALHRARTKIPTPQRTVHVNQTRTSRRRARTRAASRSASARLACRHLQGAGHARAAPARGASVTTRLFAPGETIVRKNDEG